MKWEDTVLSDEVLGSIVQLRSELFEASRVAQNQAEVSFKAGVEQASREFLGLPQGMPLYKSRHLVGEESYKAGQRSVVEWIKEVAMLLVTVDDNKTRQEYMYFLTDKWQAQLEEWGI